MRRARRRPTRALCEQVSRSFIKSVCASSLEAQQGFLSTIITIVVSKWHSVFCDPGNKARVLSLRLRVTGESGSAVTSSFARRICERAAIRGGVSMRSLQWSIDVDNYAGGAQAERTQGMLSRGLQNRLSIPQHHLLPNADINMLLVVWALAVHPKKQRVLRVDLLH